MFNKNYVFLTILLIFLSISAVSANDNLTDDIIAGNDSIEETIETDFSEGNFTELHNLIENNSEGILELDKNYKYDSSTHYSGIEIRKLITIDGKGHTIDGSDNSCIFQIYSSVILKNIIFKNAYSEKSGGALYLEGADVEIINCTFNSNLANSSGGAIYSTKSSKLNITQSTFTNNAGYGLYVEGGAIATISSEVNVNDSKFFNNVADSGGAIFSLNKSLNIVNCEFAHNIANWYGGSVFSALALNINSSKFHNNKAGLKGGAIHSSYIDNEEYLIIDNSTVSNNSAAYGGAVSSSNALYTRFYNSEFYFNNATYGAVIARLSKGSITMENTSCYENNGVNGSVIFAPSQGRITLENSNFTNNTGDYGCLIHTVQGRLVSDVYLYDITLNNCNVIDNDAKNSLIYQFYGNILINNSSFVYKNNQYPVFVILKLANGNYGYQNTWWGVDNPDFNKLICFNNTLQPLQSNPQESESDGDCSSNVIQIDENHTVISFRRDSSYALTLFIGGNGEIRQEKHEYSYFFHVLITADGWVVGNGGSDYPYKTEKIEAIARIMIGNNHISYDYLELIYNLKSVDNFGHFIIKAPDGRYGAVDYFSSSGYKLIETGVLKSGEYFLIPNDGALHKKGKVSDLIGTNPGLLDPTDYTTISRYIAATDAYSPLRTTIQTYEYNVGVVDDKLVTHVDCYVSNDDGHMVYGKNISSGNLLNDIFCEGKYILGEKIPIIMKGMFVNTFILGSVQLNKTKITVNNIKTVYNNAKYLVATLKDVKGNVLKNAKVSISLNGKVYSKVTNSKGQVKLYVNLPPKTYTAKITFYGDNKYLKSTANSKIAVKKAKVKLAAKNVMFKKSKKIKKYTVALKNNRGIVMKKVILKLNVKGKTYKAKTNKKGQATFQIKNLNKKGTFKVKIIFAGNKYYYALIKTVKIKVR